jgi:Uma2 family endonuclease
VEVRHRVTGFSERWIIPEVPVPEAAWHDGCLRLLFAVLERWLARTRIDAAVYRNIAIRVNRENRRVGFDPDICLMRPAPANATELESIRLWEHEPPVLAIEVVTPSHPYKDYVESPDKCAAAGVSELVVFDPKLVGPRIHGGPELLQLWRRAPDGGFERTYVGSGPVRSEVLDALFVFSDEERRLRLADADTGAFWPTAEEAARASEEAARASEEAARASEEAARASEEAARANEEAARANEEAALLRIEQLEAELARKG